MANGNEQFKALVSKASAGALRDFVVLARRSFDRRPTRGIMTALMIVQAELHAR